jgi:CRISPR type IV-associated DEAD/DEAH-box helicase Csf4
MIIITIRIPVSVCDSVFRGKRGAELRSAAREAVVSLCSSEPLIGDYTISRDTPSERINLSIPDPAATRIRTWAEEKGITPREVCQGLIIGMASRGEATSETDGEMEPLASFLSLTGRTEKRAPQTRFFQTLADALSHHQQISLVEAATGIGKTLAVISAACLQLQKSSSRLVIACPTVEQVRQYHRELVRLKSLGADVPGFRIVLGRREFVSPGQVLRVAMSGKLPDDAPISEIIDWVKNGGRDPDGGPAWQWYSLHRIYHSFPANEALLGEDADGSDPGFLSYQQQFLVEDDDLPEIVICTHAMLAIDVRRRMLVAGRDGDYQKLRSEIDLLFSSLSDLDGEERKSVSRQISEVQDQSMALAVSLGHDQGKLPPFTHLIVDEAHLLEQSFSSSLSSYLSISRFVDLVSRLIPKLRSKVVSVFYKLVELGRRVEEDITLNLAGSEEAVLLLRSLLDAVTSHLARVPADEERSDFLKLKRELSILRLGIECGYGAMAILSFSPIRSFPQLRVGARDVSRHLEYLWRSVFSAGCVSATLYLPRGDGFSSQYQARLLAIPDGMTREYPPIGAGAHESIRGVFVPEKIERDDHLWLAPPSRGENLSAKEYLARHTQWIDELADALTVIYAGAAGGVLALMTSFESVSSLVKVLASTRPDIPIVAADADFPLAMQKRRFLALAANGVKPLWLAVGSAWTGLDVGGHTYDSIGAPNLPPGEDNVLTDLVIPRIPFGTNKTITHKVRVERHPWMPWEILDVVFRFRQGLGRLVRRGGLPRNRRIFMLDGRVHDPSFASITTRITKMLEPLGKVERFTALGN